MELICTTEFKGRRTVDIPVDDVGDKGLSVTHGDRVQMNSEQLVKEAGPELQEVLKKVENRHHIFNIDKVDDHGQVLDLL